MHTILRVSMSDTAAANTCLSDGRFKKIIESISSELKPEGMYFYAEGGHRTGVIIFDMKDSSQIPSVAEPFFTQLNARVEFFPIMDMNELNRGLESWNKQSSNHAALS